MLTVQQILNKVRIDEDGEALKVLETAQQALNAVFDSEKKALRIVTDTGDTLPVADTTAIVKGSVDATKQVRLEVDELTTETTRVMTVPDKDIALVDKADFKPPAPVAFAGSSGRTITHNYGHTDYQIIINPVADPGGFLGEIWISKAANTAVVYNSGSATGNFDYVIIPAA